MQQQKSMTEYQAEVANRLGELSKEEASNLVKASKSPGFSALTRVMGPEISNIVTEVISEVETAFQNQQSNPQPVAMKKGGLVTKPKKKPIAKK